MAANKQKILIVDDDENIAELISLYLTKECYDTKTVGDGESALEELDSYHPDLILLDIMLPGIDGYEVCRRVRAKGQTPIIMLSAKGEVFDKVLGLELGADDYMEKPFDAKELVARVKAVLRRFQPAETKETASKKDEKIVEYPDLSINLTNYSVIYQGKRVVMPRRSWSSCTTSPPTRTGCLRGSSSSTSSGASATSETRGPWTSTSSGSARRSTTTSTGGLQRSGAWGTSSR